MRPFCLPLLRGFSAAAFRPFLAPPSASRRLLVAAGCLCIAGDAQLVRGGPLVDHEEAAALGLERSWFAQLPVDRQRSRVGRWLYQDQSLFAVTTSGTLAALDAKTGALLWSARVGKPGYPAFGPGANAQYVGAVSGARLYMFDRRDGRLAWSRELGGAPSSGPAMTERHAFIALANGQVEAYALDAPAPQPWYYQSKGRTFLRPTTTGRVVSWPTDAGLLYVCSADSPNVLFRLETDAEIVTSPTELPPYLYIASLDGYLYCIHELSGREKWRFSTGRPIDSSPAVVEDSVYVASTEPTLYAIGIDSGLEKWRVEGLQHFVARSGKRVYATDAGGRLHAVALETGAVEGSLPLAEGVTALVNNETDRLLLVSADGLVQCLHEFAQTDPLVHRRAAAERPDDATAAENANPFAEQAPAKETPAAEAVPAGDDNPFAAEEPANDAAEAGDVGEDETPADAGRKPAGDNPFGDFGF